MTINEISSIGELVFYLSGLTQRTWTTFELTREIIRLRLPVYASAPLGALIESRRRDDNGALVVTPQPSMSADYVTLLQDEIEELARSSGPRIITDRPAWQRGTAPFQSWDRITAFRAANHRVLDYWEVEQGEWMGQSDEYFFSELIQITADSILYVPSFAIAELLKADSKRQQATMTPTPNQMVGGEAIPTAGTQLIAEESQDNVAPALEKDDAGADPSRDVAVRGITKDQVITAFGRLTKIGLSKALANGKGLFGKGHAKITSGTKGGRHAALWDPVILAVGFYENYRAPRAHLNRVFTDNHFLAPWREDWQDKAEDLI
ncbi:hypothetical protein HHL21_18100 [Massilia sp. RP-1-19]|uniref:Uncharacterized protein n=1 Tax=Massilia polaris TaxID=2728846 RepID=A0A848HNM7_9BURK|nr:hypothetical protein [Massilia polaris]NML62955.1 hypothetical protein [Massilia polaris]